MFALQTRVEALYFLAECSPKRGEKNTKKFYEGSDKKMLMTTNIF